MTDDIIPLKMLCTKLKIDPRDARERLRVASRDTKKFPNLAKTHTAKRPWQWPQGSKALEEAEKALKI